MDITSFIPSQRQAILERFQQVEALGLGAVRIELKVANPVGIIYECYIMAGEHPLPRPAQLFAQGGYVAAIHQIRRLHGVSSLLVGSQTFIMTRHIKKTSFAIS